ncbi:MAG TPA: BrnT family toxin [Candidatus Saccharimonadales bacterium]|nr:BrnT family toxin [Candidatus Saccharimonadales bacterium]
MEFSWDDANRTHIAEHGVSQEEAEQVVLNVPLDLEVQIRGGEERTLQVGETDDGRLLIVVTTWRHHKVRVVTAFPAKKKIREFYEQQEGKRQAKKEDAN